MAITMYCAANWSSGYAITQVQVEKKTGHFVWVDGRRNCISGSLDSYHDNWDAAKAHLVAIHESAVFDARRRLEWANSKLGNVKGMKPPKE